MSRSTTLLLPFLAVALFAQSAFSQADYKRYFDEDNLPGVREMFRDGYFEQVVRVCEYALDRGQPSWEWRTLHFEALAALGRYEEAIEKAVDVTQAFRGELGALLRAHEFLRNVGQLEEAARILADINAAAGAVPTRERIPRGQGRRGVSCKAVKAWRLTSGTFFGGSRVVKVWLVNSPPSGNARPVVHRERRGGARASPATPPS